MLLVQNIVNSEIIRNGYYVLPNYEIIIPSSKNIIKIGGLLSSTIKKVELSFKD